MKTIADIRALNPCYDPVTGLDHNGNQVNMGYLTEGWTGTAIDILNVNACPAQDRLWVVTRVDWLDEPTMRKWAVLCARQGLELIPDPDPRSVAACDVAERYVNGQATADELAAAAFAAYAAAEARDGYAGAAAHAAAYAAFADAFAAAPAAHEAAGAAYGADETARAVAYTAQVVYLLSLPA